MIEPSLAKLIEKRQNLISALFAVNILDPKPLTEQLSTDLVLAWDQYDLAVIERFLIQQEQERL